MHPIFRID